MQDAHALYCRHTTRFILFYTFFMPFVLWRNLRWGGFFVAPLITLLLAGIDNIGIFIENPINILPMSSYCRVIHDNVILAAHDWSLGNFNVRPPPSPTSCNSMSVMLFVWIFRIPAYY